MENSASLLNCIDIMWLTDCKSHWTIHTRTYFGCYFVSDFSFNKIAYFFYFFLTSLKKTKWIFANTPLAIMQHKIHIYPLFLPFCHCSTCVVHILLANSFFRGKLTNSSRRRNLNLIYRVHQLWQLQQMIQRCSLNIFQTTCSLILWVKSTEACKNWWSGFWRQCGVLTVNTAWNSSWSTWGKQYSSNAPPNFLSPAL